MDLVAADTARLFKDIYKDVAGQHDGGPRNTALGGDCVSSQVLGSQVFSLSFGEISSPVSPQSFSIQSIAISVAKHLKLKLGNFLRIYINSWKLSLKGPEPNLTAAD